MHKENERFNAVEINSFVNKISKWLQNGKKIITERDNTHYKTLINRSATF